MSDRSRTVKCPGCGQAAWRVDTRRALPGTPKILRLRLYYCKSGEQFETSEVLVGEVTTIRRKKNFIYTHSVVRDINDDRANDYSL